MRSVILAVTLSVIVVAHARADFVLTTVSGSAGSGVGPVGQAAGPSPSTAAKDVVDTGRRSKSTGHPPASRLAVGFGDDVPLAFACRQIVPPAVKVIYGPGVNPSEMVNWKGGDTWQRVLTAAVKPLGLHARFTNLHVELRR